FSTVSGSLTTIRAIAESVCSAMLKATTWVLRVASNFTMSSIAPTLLGRKIENCFTSGPAIFEVVDGRLAAINERSHELDNMLVAVRTRQLNSSDPGRPAASTGLPVSAKSTPQVSPENTSPNDRHWSAHSLCS